MVHAKDKKFSTVASFHIAENFNNEKFRLIALSVRIYPEPTNSDFMHEFEIPLSVFIFNNVYNFNRSSNWLNSALPYYET